jgi:hypothetical protein
MIPAVPPFGRSAEFMKKLLVISELLLAWICLIISALVAIAAPLKSTPESWPTNGQLLMVWLICGAVFFAGWMLRRHANHVFSSDAKRLSGIRTEP